MALGFAWASGLLGVFLSVLFLDRMGAFQSKNRFPVDGRTVIVTGGSEGMGKALASLLAQKGANVLIVARTVQKLEAALKDISAAAIRPSSQKFHYISADLTNSSEPPRIISEATAWNNGQTPEILFCCAGASRPGLFIDMSNSTIKEQMEVNYYSAAYMAHAFLQPWLQNPTTPKTKEPKHIVFTSSIAAFLPIVGYSPYSPSKFAIRALSDSLSQELLLYQSICDMRVHTVFPGTIFSPGLETENLTKPAITKKLEESDGGQAPEEVAVSSMKGLERGEEFITSGAIGLALKAGMLGCSRRNGWGIVDTFMGWIVLIVLVIVRRDMDGTVRKWGKERLGKESG